MKESIRNLIGIEEFEGSASSRFVRILDNGEEEAVYEGEIDIIKDKITGVFYLKSDEGHLTPLLGSDGKVVIENNNW